MVARRFYSVWRARGALGFCRFLLSRLFRYRRDLIFEASTKSCLVDADWHEPGNVLVINRTNIDQLLTDQLREQLLGGEGDEYLRGIRRGDQLLVVVDDCGHVKHHSYILFQTRTKALLDEVGGTPLFANCVTQTNARGQHLYPRTLRCGLRLLAEQGHPRVVINCDPANAASVNGIKRAGFSLLAEAETWTLLNYVSFQRRRHGLGQLSLRLYIG